MYAVGFQFSRYLDTGVKPVLEDYTWWVELVYTIAQCADRFEIRCWPDEPEALATGRQYGQPIANHETLERIFQGPLTTAFVERICGDGWDRHGGLKWFAINFYKGEKLLFHSGHYGTEPVVFVQTLREAARWEEWSRKHPLISRVDVYRMKRGDNG